MPFFSVHGYGYHVKNLNRNMVTDDQYLKKKNASDR